MMSFHIFGIPDLHIFLIIIGYQAAKFQISWLSGLNFTEVDVRHQKKHLYDITM